MKNESDLTIIDLLEIYPQDGKCPVLGIPLHLTGQGIQKDGTPSVDKIIPSKGYMRGNVKIISWLANRIKSDKISPIKLFEKAKRNYEVYQAVGFYIGREIRPDYEI